MLLYGKLFIKKVYEGRIIIILNQPNLKQSFQNKVPGIFLTMHHPSKLDTFNPF